VFIVRADFHQRFLRPYHTLVWERVLRFLKLNTTLDGVGVQVLAQAADSLLIRRFDATVFNGAEVRLAGPRVGRESRPRRPPPQVMLLQLRDFAAAYVVLAGTCSVRDGSSSRQLTAGATIRAESMRDDAQLWASGPLELLVVESSLFTRVQSAKQRSPQRHAPETAAPAKPDIPALSFLAALQSEPTPRRPVPESRSARLAARHSVSNATFAPATARTAAESITDLERRMRATARVPPVPPKDAKDGAVPATTSVPPLPLRMARVRVAQGAQTDRRPAPVAPAPPPPRPLPRDEDSEDELVKIVRAADATLPLAAARGLGYSSFPQRLKHRAGTAGAGAQG
jgi:hypothetical protein